MKKIVTIILLHTICFVRLSAQQLPSWSSYYETGFVWNPALTAKWNTAETSIAHRQDWIGYDGAPQYSNISFQRPFVSGYHTKSAMGFFIERDKVGPQEKYGAALTYNYRFRPLLFGNRDDVFGIGMMFNLAQYRYDISKEVVFDPNTLAIDPTVISSVINPNAGLGVFYISVSDFYAYEKSHYYAGLSVNQLVPSTIANFNGRGDNTTLIKIQAARHATIHAGYRKIGYRQPWFYEPSIMLIYGGGKSIHAMAHIRYEMFHAFWAAGGIASTGEAFGQVGVILDRKSKFKKLVKDGSLRIGLKSSWNLGSVGQLSRPGLEFYGAYIFEME